MDTTNKPDEHNNNNNKSIEHKKEYINEKCNTEECCQIENKNNDTIENIINKNIVRTISHAVKPHLQYYIGAYYSSLHLMLMSLGFFIILFSNNLHYLLTMFIIVIIDAIVILILHDCPLTMLERKHLNTSIKDINMYCLRNMKINYNCDHDYETQLEFVINISCAIAFKICWIIIMRMTKIKISF
jgi:hypothetical protein